MATGNYAIDLNLRDKLNSPAYRRRFFLAESSAKIATQIVALRKRRGLNQKQVAELASTKQPAISRAERADYNSWSFNTLRAIADALDARIRVLIEPAEDVLDEYEAPKVVVAGSSEALVAKTASQAIAPPHNYFSHLSESYLPPLKFSLGQRNPGAYALVAIPIENTYQQEISRLRQENAGLKSRVAQLEAERATSPIIRNAIEPTYPFMQGQSIVPGFKVGEVRRITDRQEVVA